MRQTQLDMAYGAEAFRIPQSITEMWVGRRERFYICPRCHVTMEREFMSYCDRCGQCLDWKGYRRASIVRTGDIPSAMGDRS